MSREMAAVTLTGLGAILLGVALGPLIGAGVLLLNLGLLSVMVRK